MSQSRSKNICSIRGQGKWCWQCEFLPICLDDKKKARQTLVKIIQLFPRDFTQPYVQQGSLGIEVKVEKDLAISASYLVAKGTHLQRVRDVNLATPTAPAMIGVAGTTVLNFQRFTLPQPIATFDRILLFESSASSNYHGLVVQAIKGFSYNFQFLGSYTLGKVIDDNRNVHALGVGATNALLVADPSKLSGDRGPGSNDQRLKTQSTRQS